MAKFLFFSFLNSFQTYQQAVKKLVKYFSVERPEQTKRNFETYISRLIQFAKAHEIKIYLVIYPIFSDDEKEQNERKLNIINEVLASKKADLKVIDLYTKLSNLSDYQNSKWDNTHTNSVGSQKILTMIFNKIRSKTENK